MQYDLEKMSGENDVGKKSPKLILNTIKFNGTDGKFIYQLTAQDKVIQDGKEEYKFIDLGPSIDVVFLKIRRTLVQFRKGDTTLRTIEHTSPESHVILYGLPQNEKGKAKEIRAIHEGLRTHQVVYALYKGELVRIVFKGASLGSDDRPKENPDFYGYIASFDKRQRQHFYNINTNLKAIETKGPLGKFYYVTYAKGTDVKEKNMEIVGEKMQQAFEFCEEYDAYYAELFPKQDVESGVEKMPYEPSALEMMEPSPDYPDEDINIDDIPF